MSNTLGIPLSRRAFTGLLGIAATGMIAPALAGCSTESSSAAPEAPETGRPQPPQTPPTDTAPETGRPQPPQTPPTDTAPEAPAPESAAGNEPEAPSSQERENPMKAVVYFSVTGNTRNVAENLAALLGATAQAITPAEPYTSADIDYNSDCRANMEQQDDLSIRPTLADPLPDATDATTVFLGYPIWWGKVPRVVLTYVESGALSGKAVAPFCTSGSSGIEGSLAELEAADPSITWKPGRRFETNASEATLQTFIDESMNV